MSELQNYYDNYARANVWADSDPERCGCHGSGWFLSDLDTFHRCPVHYTGQPHPEEDTPNEPCSEQHVGEDSLPENKGSDEGGTLHDVPF